MNSYAEGMWISEAIVYYGRKRRMTLATSIHFF